ncbi:MAG: hypothetical protein PHE02_12575 [Lachnospiraceae bacterium]|nr:hypothetical protein [Lachnospiraceae bacterium]
MLKIILLLKIIGIVLLIVLLLAICLLILILFCPIRYGLRASYDDDLEAYASVHWLLHILSVRATYKGESNVVVRVFGIPIYRSDAPKKETDKTENNSRKNRNKKNEQTTKDRKTSQAENSETKISVEKENTVFQKTDPKETEDKQGEKEQDPQGHKDSKNANSNSIKDEIPDDEKNTSIESDSKIESTSQTERIVRKISAFCEKIYKFFQKIKYTILGIYDTIKTIYHNLAYYNHVLHSTEMQEAISLCRKQFITIWKNIRPRKYQLYLHIGNEDPSVIGEIMAFFGMLYPFVGSYVTIAPEFDRSVLEVDCKAKGRITVFILLKVLLTIYFNKNLKRVLQLLKKEDLHV